MAFWKEKKQDSSSPAFYVALLYAVLFFIIIHILFCLFGHKFIGNGNIGALFCPAYVCPRGCAVFLYRFLHIFSAQISPLLSNISYTVGKEIINGKSFYLGSYPTTVHIPSSVCLTRRFKYTLAVGDLSLFTSTIASESLFCVTLKSS
jgi:hypothetical protein